MDLVETGAYHFKVLVQLDIPSGASCAFLGALVPIGGEYLPADSKLGLLTFGCDSRVEGISPSPAAFGFLGKKVSVKNESFIMVVGLMVT